MADNQDSKLLDLQNELDVVNKRTDEINIQSKRYNKTLYWLRFICRLVCCLVLGPIVLGAFYSVVKYNFALLFVICYVGLFLGGVLINAIDENVIPWLENLARPYVFKRRNLTESQFKERKQQAIS